MLNSLFENEGYEVEIGPLLWYQRPLVLGMFILVGFLFVGFVTYVIATAKSVEKDLRHSKNNPDEIAYDTIETSTTSNDRLLVVHDKLLELDRVARRYFGDLHYWHDPDNEPAPKQVNLFNHSLNDPENRFLILYNEVAFTRFQLEKELEILESNVDRSVSELGGRPTADSRFRAIRLLKDVAKALEELGRQISVLNKLGQQYKERNGKPW